MKLFLTPLVAAVSLLGTTRAPAALNPSIVASDAQWVVHIDLNTLRDSVLGREIVAEINQMSAQAPQNGLKVDVPKLLATVGTLTAYGSNFTNNPELIDGTLVIQGTEDLRKIAEGYVAQATVSTPDQFTEIKDLPFEAYALKNGPIIAFPKEPIILASRSKAQLLKAHELFLGHGASLASAGRSSPLTSLVSGGSDAFLVAASQVPSEKFFPEGAPQARILQMATSASVSLGEKAANGFARLRLVAASDEMADKLTKIVQGLTAMASLAETDDKQLGEFLKSVRVDRNDRSINISLSYPSDRLITMFKNIRDTHEAREQQGAKGATPAAKPEAKPANVIDEWTADQELGNNGPAKETLVSHSIENVALTTGSTIVLTARRQHEENGRIDAVEITGPNGKLKFEAEAMRLKSYRVEKAPFASGGKLIVLTSYTGNARFQFPGVEGDYTLKVFYIDEADGKANFSVSVLPPDETTAAQE
jgi:hypothetical protein